MSEIIGKCPSCTKSITEIKAVPAPVKDHARTLKGVVYVCPSCTAILGTALDPLLTLEETVDRIVNRLKS